MSIYKSLVVFAGLFGITLLTFGCSKDTATNKEEEKKTQSTQVSTDDHSGWWCTPHGIPEEECSMCSASYATECKEKGDWCEEHNRAKSQCFKCDPLLADKYVKLYEAKYGEKPPAATE